MLVTSWAVISEFGTVCPVAASKRPTASVRRARAGDPQEGWDDDDSVDDSTRWVSTKSSGRTLASPALLGMAAWACYPSMAGQRQVDWRSCSPATLGKTANFRFSGRQILRNKTEGERRISSSGLYMCTHR